MSTKRYAPAPGVDPEFDKTEENVWQALEASGNPEGVTREQSRETLAEKMAKYGGKPYTAQEIDEKETAYVETDEPIELVIPTLPKGEPYWYEKPSDARMFEHFVMTRRALGNVFDGALAILGPAGIGKTLGVPKAIARLNQKYNLSMTVLKMDCATVTDPQKWIGRREVDEKGTHFHESDFIRGCRDGAVILLDEITRIHPQIGNFVHPLLDGSQAIHLSDLNLTINVNPQTVFIATANIGAQFGGTHRMDWALRERFAYTILKDYPPAEEEVHILTSATEIDPDAASVLVRIADRTRQMHREGDLRSAISPRTLVKAAWLVRSGMTEREALEYTALPMFDDSADGVAGEQSEQVIVAGIIKGRGLA